MANVEIYSKDHCPFCIRAKNLLAKKGINYTEHFYNGQNDEMLQEMLDRANGMRTFPQIFIDGQHIGGCDDLYQLENDSRLDPLLNR